MKGLYIHIPFCKRLCTYCDFPKRIGQKEENINNYINKLIEEIKCTSDNSFDTVYLGGGTPNSLSLYQLEEILENIKKTRLKRILEYTIETNYELITLEQVKLFQKYEINRVSIGVQTLKPCIANTINRVCNYDLLKDKIKMLKDHGITNINLDFIFGLPNQTINNVKKDLEMIKELDVAHISYYSLILEDKTVLQHQLDKKMISLPSDDETGEMFKLIIKTLKDYGYHHYEISNFSKPGYESKHNLIYWNLEEYVGLGMSAASYTNGVRKYNSKLLNNYLKDCDIIKEEINKEDAMGEYFWLGLRKIDGVSVSEFKTKFDTDPFEKFDIAKLIDKKLLVVDGDFIKLTDFGLEHGNYVFSNFI